MTGTIDSALQERINAYLERLRQALGALPPEETADIVREIRGHIVERAESTDLLNEVTLKGILGALGDPEDIGSLYQSRAMVARARASMSPLLILRSTTRWAGKSLAGLGTFFFGLFGYGLGFGFLVTAILKVLHPDRVGLWVSTHRWNLSLGTLTAAEQSRDHAQELLGWWLIPFGLIAGPLLVVVTTLLLRWALRFAFPPTSARRNPSDGSSQ